MLKRKLLALNNILRPEYVKDKKRIARGPGSKGCKSGRGSDGQKARSGSNSRTEGGQFMSYLSVKKRGFTRTKEKIEIIKTSQLIALSEKIKKDIITLEEIQNYLKISKNTKYKVLFDKATDKKLSVDAHFASKKSFVTVKINVLK